MKITLMMEKLSNHWQLRFLVVGAGLALVVFAVLLPDPGARSRGAAIQSVSAAPSSYASGMSADGMTAAQGNPGISAAAGTGGVTAPWLGENEQAARQLRLAASSDEDAGLPVDTSECVRHLRALAGQGDRLAQYLLGHAYQIGLGVPKDMTETARWYALAAQPRSGGATTEPAISDFAQALDAYRALAERGDRNAELYFGLAYDLGLDVPRNVAEAERWYRRAAAQGSASAASNLGVIDFNGTGVAKDDVEAASWFRTAADRGCASAQYSLGLLYHRGYGVGMDDSEAASWLNKAANRGYAPAQKLLSLLYATGRGVSGSTPMAYMWINLASAGDGQARDSREHLEKVIPNREIAEGQRLTHAWLAEHGSAARD